MKIHYISILLLFLIQSCETKLTDEEFIMSRNPYNGNEIRLDGCYVSKMADYNSYIFFYSNGIIFSFGIQLNINNISQIDNVENIRNYKGLWGLFQIENENLKTQSWKQQDISTQFIIKTRIYNIVNDTTLSVDLLNDGNIRYYHFKHVMPKPDSTNVFIK